MFGRVAAIAVVVAVAVMGGKLQTQQDQRGETTVRFGVEQAQAAPRHRQARRVSRRTARRTTRRTVRRLTVLPAGCIWRAPYHYCGGIYYSAVVESGTTYYIVVTP